MLTVNDLLECSAVLWFEHTALAEGMKTGNEGEKKKLTRKLRRELDDDFLCFNEMSLF